MNPDSDLPPAPLVIDFIDGWCPVQAEGTVGGKPFYFRSRGQHWTMSIGGEDIIMKPEWHRRRHYSDVSYSAGWIEVAEAEKFIRESAADYLAGKAP